jgi:ubiquinone/menaquinone biosynthesis C-methylase UbiE
VRTGFFMPWIYDGVMAPLAPLRRRVVPRARGRVLEIGSGTGLNFAHYPSSIEELVALDPEPDFGAHAARRARGRSFAVRFEQAAAERLPFADASFDSVVATFVLCCVHDPQAALAEIRRVLRPGGALLYAEHVRSPGTVEARLQDLLTPAWRTLAGGCHLNRATPELLADAGFAAVETHRSRRLLPLFPFVWGLARAA